MTTERFSTGKLRDGRRVVVREEDGIPHVVVERRDPRCRTGGDPAFHELFRIAKLHEDAQWVNARGAGWSGVVDGIEVYTFDDYEAALRHPIAVADRARQMERAKQQWSSAMAQSQAQQAAQDAVAEYQKGQAQQSAPNGAKCDPSSPWFSGYENLP